MPRSGGVTFSAALVFIGSAFALLCGVFAVLGGLLASQRALAADPAGFHSILIIEAVFWFGFGGWGIASGIGLIKTRQWARISMVVFACLLLFVSLPTVAIMAFAPLPKESELNLPPGFMTIVRAIVVVWFGLTAALGGFWLYFFNRKSVKAQFQAAPPAALGMAAGVPPAVESPSRRPLSIAIIGWYLLITSALSPLFVLFFGRFFPQRSMPLAFLGHIYFGRVATLILVATAVVQVVAAIGLLKLKNWGRLVTIGLQLLTILNSVLIFGPPASRARFQQVMDTMVPSGDPQMAHAFTSSFPAWIGALTAGAVVLVVLWFLFAERKAFHTSEA